MNRDIKELLNEAIKNEPPAKPLDVDALAAEGNRRIRGNRLGVAGAAAGTLAVVTAAALILPGAFGGTGSNETSSVAADEDQNLETDNEQGEYPVPPLDPDRKYRYGNSSNTSVPETEQLTEVFWSLMAASFPDMVVFSFGGADPLPPDLYPTMSRSESDLLLMDEDTEYPTTTYGDEGEPIGYSRPIYGFAENAGFYGTIWTVTDPDRKVYDEFDLTIHPKGSFDTEPKSYPNGSASKPPVPHLTTGCEDQLNSGQGGTDNFEQDYTCSESTGPNGEPVQVVELTLSVGNNGNHDFISMKAITVIVTLENGNAVVFTNMYGSTEVDGEHGAYLDLADIDPAMSADDMVELAISLPQVVVH
ncbi:hypothetical protein FB566_5181 [Stackebrandtia endophytica]|uniref:Uncharacterized protein n=1 Tax=Stackebrandtia endophytica TaxID=1496996 RepID=A0A543B408_9ACTN|nr:hypothetical protein [Stackebrandtia endophytica]TQL79571.1 hypothetical protein FB566_5181 [Stackebrandtia endophytica]